MCPISSSSFVAESHTDVVDGIYQGLYTPKKWPALASKMYAAANFVYNNVTSPLLPRGLEVSTDLRSPHPFGIPRISRRSQSLNDWAFQAITCGDAIDSGNTTTKDVFNEIILASTTVSEMCMFCRPSCFFMQIFTQSSFSRSFLRVWWILLSQVSGSFLNLPSKY